LGDDGIPKAQQNSALLKERYSKLGEITAVLIYFRSAVIKFSEHLLGVLNMTNDFP
jgi:hypothetical protein